MQRGNEGRLAAQSLGGRPRAETGQVHARIFGQHERGIEQDECVGNAGIGGGWAFRVEAGQRRSRRSEMTASGTAGGDDLVFVVADFVADSFFVEGSPFTFGCSAAGSSRGGVTYFGVVERVGSWKPVVRVLLVVVTAGSDAAGASRL